MTSNPNSISTPAPDGYRVDNKSVDRFRIYRLAWSVLISGALSAAVAAAPPSPLAPRKPATSLPSGWRLASLPPLSPAQAALLREFHLRWRMASVPAIISLPSAAAPSLLLEHFRSASGAYAAYTFQRAFGSSGHSRAIPHLSRAWQSPRQWTLLSSRNVILLRGSWSAHQLQSALRWAASLPAGIAARDIPPDLPLHLPAPHRAPGSLRYGYGPAALASAAPWFPAAAANFSDGPEFAATQYVSPQGSAHLLLWSYPTPQIAHAQLQMLRPLLSAHHLDFVRRSGSWLIVVRTSNASLAHFLLTAIHQRIHITWSHIGPSQVVLAAELLLSILVFVALMMGASVVVGILGGWLRRQLAQKFPRRFSPQAKSFIWLDLNRFESKPSAPPDTK